MDEYLVINKKDIYKYLSKDEQIQLQDISMKIFYKNSLEGILPKLGIYVDNTHPNFSLIEKLHNI